MSYGGSLGTGMFADITAKALADAGIGTLPLARQAIDQGTCAVLVDSSGERSFISHHGAERKIDAAGLDAIDVSEGDWILLTGYSLFKPETAAAFLPWLQRLRKDANFIFDPGPVVAEIPTPALNVAVQRADWISANLSEAGILTGLSDPAAAALELSRRRKGAIVRTGADGCWLSCAGHVQHIAGFEVDAVDTNGAGDTHDGVFIAANCLGYGARDAACLANAAAALSTTRHGPATAPDLATALSFIRSRGIVLNEPDRQALRKNNCEQPGAASRPQQGEVK